MDEIKKFVNRYSNDEILKQNTGSDGLFYVPKDPKQAEIFRLALRADRYKKEIFAIENLDMGDDYKNGIIEKFRSGEV